MFLTDTRGILVYFSSQEMLQSQEADHSISGGYGFKKNGSANNQK